MTTILIALFTVVLILICAFVVLIILMQRASSNAGMGSALGGGAMESALGGGASNILTKGTVIGVTSFFVLSFVLYIAHMATSDADVKTAATLPSIEAIAPEEEPEVATPSALGGALTDEPSNSITVDGVPVIPEESQAAATEEAAALKANLPEKAAVIEEAAAETPDGAAVVTSPDEAPAEEESAADAAP